MAGLGWDLWSVNSGDHHGAEGSSQGEADGLEGEAAGIEGEAAGLEGQADGLEGQADGLESQAAGLDRSTSPRRQAPQVALASLRVRSILRFSVGSWMSSQPGADHALFLGGPSISLSDAHLHVCAMHACVCVGAGAHACALHGLY